MLSEKGNMNTKREIIGSIFPEKFVFEKFISRTACINEAVSKIYLITNQLKSKKNGTNQHFDDLYRSVTRPGLEPRQTEPESVVLPLYYRAIQDGKIKHF